jgi:hypothetical protein
MTDVSHNEVARAPAGFASWRPLGVPKRFVLLFGGLIALLVVPHVVWSQTSRVRYLDINSGATKRTVEVFGIRVSSSPGLEPVHVVPGLRAEWRWAGMTKGGGRYTGVYGGAVSDYLSIDLALSAWEADAAMRERVFANWRDHLRGGYYGHLEFVHASEDESDDWPPVAARVENEDGQWVMIFDFRE